MGSAGGFDCFCARRESRPAASCSLQPRGECSPQSKSLLRQVLITLHVAAAPRAWHWPPSLEFVRFCRSEGNLASVEIQWGRSVPICLDGVQIPRGASIVYITLYEVANYFEFQLYGCSQKPGGASSLRGSKRGSWNDCIRRLLLEVCPECSQFRGRDMDILTVCTRAFMTRTATVRSDKYICGCLPAPCPHFMEATW